MKQFYLFLIVASAALSTTTTQAQCNGIKGPNLLGAKGTFSAPFITNNTTATNCLQQGTHSYNPIANVGNPLTGCTSPGIAVPCSDYLYTAASSGLNPEARYTILKVIGNADGGNCIKPEWRGADHTGDNGYFMIVNGAPNNTYSPVFYKIKTIPVCLGATYEFSAWVINMLPAGHPSANPGSEPNISFKVNGTVIGNSGPIAYTSSATWVKVGGSFVATTSTVDLEVVNATAVALGNDLGLDDISINVCQSQIAVNGPATICTGSTADVEYTVTDATQTHSWYQWQVSADGGTNFVNVGTPGHTNFAGNSFTLRKSLGIVTAGMIGLKHRLVVSTSSVGLADPGCQFFNDYTVVQGSCTAMPVSLIAFNGKYNNSNTTLTWQTSQEINSDYFEVLRSFNGEDYTVVGTVKAAGSSSTVKNYQFQDAVAGTGYVYYRLRQVDAVDARSSLSNIIRLNMGSKETLVEIYPNPFVSSFTASFSATKNANATVVIRNIGGQVLYTKTIIVSKGSNSVQLSNLPVLGPGLYMVSILNDEINFQGKIQKL